MGKRGPPALPDELKAKRGTLRADRSHPRQVPNLDGDPVKPTWLRGRASTLWDAKVATYRNRGQSVRGCESLLAQFCKLEASIIRLWERAETPTPSQLNTLKAIACQFYDTPASQISKTAGGQAPEANPFLSHGTHSAGAPRPH